MQAFGADSRLNLYNDTITQTAKGVLQASGSDAQVYLSKETISGGTLKTVGTGTINVVATSTLDGRNGHGVTVAGQVNVAGNSGQQIEGSIVNNGTVTLHGNSTDPTTLTVIAATTLSGTGHITSDGSDETHTGLSISGTLDNVSNTISGTGFIVGGTLHNGAKGVVGAMDGDMLSIAGVTLNNEGKLEAAGTGHLDMSSDHIVNGKAGSIFTTAGAEIDISNTDITGGAINIVKNSLFDDNVGSIDQAKITNACTFTGMSSTSPTALCRIMPVACLARMAAT